MSKKSQKYQIFKKWAEWPKNWKPYATLAMSYTISPSICSPGMTSNKPKKRPKISQNVKKNPKTPDFQEIDRMAKILETIL